MSDDEIAVVLRWVLTGEDEPSATVMLLAAHWMQDHAPGLLLSDLVKMP